MSEERKILTAADILGAEDLQPITVYVPEWNGSVRIRPVTAAEALRFAEDLKKNESEAGLRMLAATAVDEQGKPLFTAEDVRKLSTKSLRAINRLQEASLILNGLREEKKVAEAAKNA
jgi:hypothetical protein